LPECFKKEYLTQSIHLKHCLQPLGEFEFYVRVFPQYHTTFIGGFLGILGKPTKEQAFLRINSEDKENRVCFSGPVYIPIIAKKDKDPEKDEIWMSLTPMEIFTLRPALEIAKGNVLIAGLGMGWLTQRVLELETVSSVTQIELNSEILDFFGKPLINKFPDKIRLINQDIWEFIRQNNVKNFDTILFDIWPKINDSKRDKNFKKLMAAHPNVWGWGYENEV
jgi:hypothetical protein